MFFITGNSMRGSEWKRQKMSFLNFYLYPISFPPHLDWKNNKIWEYFLFQLAPLENNDGREIFQFYVVRHEVGCMVTSGKSRCKNFSKILSSHNQNLLFHCRFHEYLFMYIWSCVQYKWRSCCFGINWVGVHWEYKN